MNDVFLRRHCNESQADNDACSKKVSENASRMLLWLVTLRALDKVRQ